MGWPLLQRKEDLGSRGYFFLNYFIFTVGEGQYIRHLRTTQ